MKLWLISQYENTGYDTYDSAVVAAETEDRARMIHPSIFECGWDGKYDSSWASSDKIIVKLIGEAIEDIDRGVICSSYNAG